SLYVGEVGVPKDATKAPVPVKVFVNVRAFRFVLFRILHISARNCIFSFSPRRSWFLNTKKSSLRNTGIWNRSRPKFPSTPGAGKEKHEVLMRWPMSPVVTSFGEQPGRFPK